MESEDLRQPIISAGKELFEADSNKFDFMDKIMFVNLFQNAFH